MSRRLRSIISWIGLVYNVQFPDAWQAIAFALLRREGHKNAFFFRGFGLHETITHFLDFSKRIQRRAGCMCQYTSRRAIILGSSTTENRLKHSSVKMNIAKPLHNSRL